MSNLLVDFKKIHILKSMDFRRLIAGKDDDKRRLDRILRIYLQDKSLGEIYKLIRKGLIKVNDKKIKPEIHINEGDIICIADFLFEQKTVTPLTDEESSLNSHDSLNIVFENEHLLIIDKPYGRSVHGSENETNSGLDREVIHYLQKAKKPLKESLSFRPGPLHRLDKNTSGLLVFSKSLEGAHWFTEHIKDHSIQKKYYGLAEGKIEKEEKWEDKISDSKTSVKGFHTVIQNEMGLTAQTIAKPVGYGKLRDMPVTLVEYAIKTGRKHQIRIQSSLHGHPLAGDSAYGGSKNKALKREYYLQAYSLSFPENMLGLPSEIKIRPSTDFISILEYCEIKNPGL